MDQKNRVKVNMMQSPSAVKVMDNFMARRFHESIGQAVEDLFQRCNLNLCPTVDEPKNCAFYILEGIKLLLDSVPHRLGFNSRENVVDFLIACRDVFGDEVDLDLSSWHSLLTCLKSSVQRTLPPRSPAKRRSDEAPAAPNVKRPKVPQDVSRSSKSTDESEETEEYSTGELALFNIMPIKQEPRDEEDEDDFDAQDRDEETSFTEAFTPLKVEPGLVTASGDQEEEDLENPSHATMQQTKWAVKLFKGWLTQSSRDPDFEHLPAKELCDLLVEFFSVASNRQGHKYGTSSMINIRSGLNRYLRLPPFSRPFNLMRGEDFHRANKVLKKRLTEKYHSESTERNPHRIISPSDLEHIQEYFMTHMEVDPEVLQQKVFFDLCFYLSKRGRDSFRHLTKDSFELCTSNSGREYLKLTDDEANFSGKAKYDEANILEKRGIIVAQDLSPKCPVRSFKLYLSKINYDVPFFFQRPSRSAGRWYDRQPVGKNSLSGMMKAISNRAGLSTIYGNFCIKATANVAKGRFRPGRIEAQVSDAALADCMDSNLLAGADLDLRDMSEQDYANLSEGLFFDETPVVYDDHDTQEESESESSKIQAKFPTLKKVLKGTSDVTLKKEATSTKRTTATPKKEGPKIVVVLPSHLSRLAGLE